MVKIAYRSRRAVDVIMARAKRICPFIINFNKLFFFSFVAMFSERNHRKHVVRVFIEVYRNSWEVWQIWKKLWKHSPAACISHFPNFHSFFYNSTDTRYMFSISVGRGLTSAQKYHPIEINLISTPIPTPTTLSLCDYVRLTEQNRSTIYDSVV